MRREVELDGIQTQVLSVPWYSQSDSDYLCTVYSLKMVISFFCNEFEEEDVREAVNPKNKDELINITNTRTGVGTEISSELMEKLEEEVETLKFRLEETEFEKVSEYVREGYPPILVYNPSAFFIDEKGPAHTCVVIGMTDRKLILNNPWYGPRFTMDRTAFERVWEIENSWCIFIEPNYEEIEQRDIYESS